jgi:hypothetical protein
MPRFRQFPPSSGVTFEAQGVLDFSFFPGTQNAKIEAKP